MPEYAEVNSQVLQDVVQRVDRAFQAFFRRVKAGETPGYPRFHGRDRYNSFTYPQVGEHGGARLDNGFLVLSKIGRIAVRWSRPLEGTPKTVTISREADGWYVCFSCAEVPIQPLATYRARDGHRPWVGIVRHPGGWHAHLRLPAAIARPSAPENSAAPVVSHDARRGAIAAARRSSCWPKRTRR